MWPGAACGVLALLVATQGVQAACQPRPPQDTTTPSTPASPSDEVFTTSDGVRFRVETLLTGLEVPWSLVLAPDGRAFVTERPGRVRVVDLLRGRSEIALTVQDVFAQGEGGLLGIALDPDFADTRWVYLYYTAATAAGPVNRLVRYREVGGRLGERALLLDNVPGAVIHNGGRIRFGPDERLYISTGDANNALLAQDLASLAGKILRLDRDGTTPRDNPFASPVFSYGHRNPQGFGWRPIGAEMWASEHGAAGNDEINQIRSGLNYGWPRIEGSQTMPGMERPVAFFTPAIAPSGASFYDGRRFPGFAGDLFVATLRGMHLRRLRIDAARRVVLDERLLEGRFGRLRDVIAGPDGHLYVLTSNRDGRGSPIADDDRILRLVPAP
ncbi:MAG TPA: PQQ-dependent sugar dehydrogenase [Vicinamibacterales bacterium]|nr:PQQ-dependent sugar dehydrogenase [Vicinamibacterales bacterium]